MLTSYVKITTIHVTGAKRYGSTTFPHKPDNYCK